MIKQMAKSIPDIAKNIEIKMAKEKPSVKHKIIKAKAL
jgi:hypothetical protein